MKEAATQAHIRLALAQAGSMMWRNNSGAATDKTGRLIRYGLGNDSKRVQEQYRSADLVGITPVLVTPEMVGKWVGIFTAVEVKAPGFRGPNEEREFAQQRWLALVRSYGGRADFAASVEQALRVITQ